MIKKNIDKQEAIQNIANWEDGMNKLTTAIVCAAMSIAAPAFAQTKLQIGCTATSDCASAMVAVDESTASTSK